MAAAAQLAGTFGEAPDKSFDDGEAAGCKTFMACDGVPTELAVLPNANGRPITSDQSSSSSSPHVGAGLSGFGLRRFSVGVAEASNRFGVGERFGDGEVKAPCLSVLTGLLGGEPKPKAAAAAFFFFQKRPRKELVPHIFVGERFDKPCQSWVALTNI